MLLKNASLPPDIVKITCDKATEYPQTGQYYLCHASGSYLCRQCGIALFRSQHKFQSHCGWPSFDEAIPHVVKQQPDVDGQRTEIVCARCDAHLGHVFEGEQLTPRNIRFCVNSASLDFVSATEITDTEEGIFAAGCFWGVEYLFKKLPGVVKTEVGYSGGSTIQPNYNEVCAGHTGHLEVVRVLYDVKQLNFAKLAKYFFEIHDPTQVNGQGPDIGEQYHSAIFYYDQIQYDIATTLLQELTAQGDSVCTRVIPVSTFWAAEDYHQDYYNKTGKQPYCHHYQKRFKR